MKLKGIFSKLNKSKILPPQTASPTMNPVSNADHALSPQNTFLVPSQLHQYNPPTSTFGHPITTKHPNSIRLLLQYPNGISSNDDCFEFKLYLKQMKSLLDVDIIAMSETNINWKDYQVYKHTTQHRKTTYVHSHHVPSCSSKSFDTAYQPGGCSLTLCSNITG